ncbi:hypothetical protein GCM10019059_36900 [Camelimonas fluminis]|nr:hypothetical protein GCM10019059_36900 [Camelimonas fluminis]
MQPIQIRTPGPGKVEIRLFFRTWDDVPIVERIYLDKNCQQSMLLEMILRVWGTSPEMEELSFFMSMDNVGRVVATKQSLVMYINGNKQLYGVGG